MKATASRIMEHLNRVARTLVLSIVLWGRACAQGVSHFKPLEKHAATFKKETNSY